MEYSEYGTDNLQKVNGWILDKLLGSGGNAKVWRAHRPGSTEFVAIKVLDSKKVQSERYKRFVQEVETLRRLPMNSGVLPLLDFSLPEAPSHENPAWLTTEIANPLSTALAEADLATVIGAMCTIATTLARLHDSLGIVHRDLKPDNLYEHAGRWLVGDFGLVVNPDTRGLTIPGRKLGPAHFSPYELIDGGIDADMPPVDVYMLGKSLWVLATGNKYPPPGNQAAVPNGFQIADFVDHPHAEDLDQLVESMTALRPTDRPSMATVANELDAWLNLPVEEFRSDDSAQQRILQSKLADRDTEDERIKRIHLNGARTLLQVEESFSIVGERLFNFWIQKLPSIFHTTNLLKGT